MARQSPATFHHDETPVVCYVDANSATRTTCRKLDGIRRFAAGAGWEVVALNKRESHPSRLAETFARIRPAGCIMECSTDRDDLPRRLFGGIPTVYLDCRPTLYRGRVPMVCHDNALTAHAAYREHSFANPCAFGVVDNASDVCELCSPPLSSIQVDFELAGYRAAELLSRAMRGDSSCRREMFGPLLVVRRDSTRGHGRTEKRVFDAVDLIRRQACEGLRAIDVVKALGWSRRLAELRFREAFGRSILEAITDVRMDRVAQLLRDPSVPISTVVTESGFNSSGALRKVFLIRTGLSLSAWRKLHVVKAAGSARGVRRGAAGVPTPVFSSVIIAR